MQQAQLANREIRNANSFVYSPRQRLLSIRFFGAAWNIFFSFFSYCDRRFFLGGENRGLCDIEFVLLLLLVLSCLDVEFKDLVW